jgi:hypothetical protein|nr:MAG TPA_asm: hypothetical protein [Caudoviricetes sp.]
MKFDEWIKQSYPNKGNNEHTVYSINDMHSAFFAGTMHGTQKEEKTENALNNNDNNEQIVIPELPKKKTYKAKTTSLIAQIIAALWVAVWCAKKFMTSGGETNDIILSGFAIAACFSPVYFNMILDKVKSIRFGE